MDANLSDAPETAEVKMERPKVTLPGATDTLDPSEARERLLLSGQPVRQVMLPNGRIIGLHPKPQAYFYRIEEAIHDYLQALATYDIRAARRLRWPMFWWRQFRRRLALDRIEQAKYRLLRLMLADRYCPERHYDLTVEEFLSLPHDVVLRILEGYREANDVEDILRRLIRDYGKKKEAVDKILTASSTRL